MKNRLIILWIVILTMLSINQLQASVMFTSGHEINKEQAKVYFGFDEITEADINTFTILLIFHWR